MLIATVYDTHVEQLFDRIQQLHSMLTEAGMPYRLVGGMAVFAHALARKFGWRIQPDGATAQNLLGLSTQVPARAIYLSDGPDRSYAIGRTKLAFEHTALKEAGFKLPESFNGLLHL